ncbi:protein Flattop isoform X2 [Sparus aurata]|uniref:protein Flattop isoform X2 n=1 Tax=Sparus aurata TaxID=8175 RepID=UPI0011C0DAF0|nr:protein Flattop isoform X2 [Sparus aurata]
MQRRHQKKSWRQTDAEMSSNYSANQYDSAFRSQRLQNWCETKCFNQRPTAHGGHTTFTSDNRGHLLPGVVKRGSAWPDFKGTWDLPARIPAHPINPTSRSVEGLDRLKCWGFDLQHTGTSRPHSKNKYIPKNVDTQTNGDVRWDAAAMSSAAEARQATQNLPIPGDRGPATQNHDSQAAVVGPIGEPDEEKPARQAAEPVQRDEEKPALRHAAGEGTITGERRIASNVAE